MTANEFNDACTVRTINPAIALEDVDIRHALQDHDNEAVCELLDTNF